MNNRLRFLRDALDLTLAEFAERIGVEHSSIYLWEKRKSPLPLARQRMICEEFGVNPDWLATGKGEIFTRPIDAETAQRIEKMTNKASTISGRLQILRKHLKLTLEKFGARIGVKGGVVGSWETDRQNIPLARQRIICEEFGVNPDWFMSGTGDMFDLSAKSGAPLNLDAAAEIALKAFDALPADIQTVVLEIAQRVLAARPLKAD